MKLYKIILSCALIAFISCSTEEELEESRIDTSTPALTVIDQWIRTNLTDPYNINVDYLFRDNEVATNRYLAPPKPEVIIPFMEAYMEFMVEPFENLAGEEFVRRYFSKQLVLVGSQNFNNDGTVFLGQAEGGVKVTLYELNLFLERTSLENNTPEQVRAQFARYFKTLHHEFSHILQQSKPYDKESFRVITPQYRSTWYNLSTQEARNLGYISPYASSNEDEDFVEMVSIMLTTSPETFEAILDSPTNAAAKQAMRAKLEIILNYYKTAWGIDLYELQQNISEKFDEYLETETQTETENENE